MNYKAILRIPTKDPFAFLELHAEDVDNVIDLKNLKETYDSAIATMNSSNTSEFAFYAYLIALMDSNLALWGTADEYAQLNEKQKEVVQSIKRMAKRLKNKE